MTYQIAVESVPTDLFFLATGALKNTVDSPEPAQLAEDDGPIFAFAHDLGTVGTPQTTPVVYTIGHERDPLVQFSNVPNVNNTRRPYYFTRYSNVLDMVYPLHTSCVAVLIWPLAGRRPPQ